MGKGWRIQNRQKFEEEGAGTFSVSNFALHLSVVIPVSAVSRTHMERVSEEGKIVHRGLF